MKRKEFETLLPVIAAIEQYLEVITSSLKSKHELPALTLMFSLIDVLSWLGTTKSKKTVRDRFVFWVESFLLKSGKIKCSALDLYAARCSIIHTLTSDSSLSDSGNAKRAIYTTDKSKEKHLQKYEIDTAKFFILNINLLHRELESAILNFTRLIDEDLRIKKNVLQKANRFYWMLPKTESHNETH